MRLSTKKEIFEFAKNELPLDPFVEGEESWDALADSIGGGLEQFRGKGVVILVKNDANHRIQPSNVAIELIDIFFQIKKDQLSSEMKIYFCVT